MYRCFFGAVGDVTPFSSLLVWNENIKHSWDSPQQRAPIPHAELLTLAELAEQVPDVELETMLTNLKTQGIEVESTDVVLGELAESYNMTPARLNNIALGQTGPGRDYGGSGQGGRHGQGGYGAGGPGGESGQREITQGDVSVENLQGGPGRGIGRMTLKAYCNQMGLDVNAAVKQLQEAGFKAGPDMTIRGIADTAGVHPSEIRTLLEAQIP